MLQIRPLFVSIALTLAASAVQAATLPNGMIYSANEGDGSISEITLSTGAVRTANVSVIPHNIQISPDNKVLLAVGMSATSTNAHGAHGGTAQDDAKAGSHTDNQASLLLLNTSQLGQV